MNITSYKSFYFRPQIMKIYLWQFMFFFLLFIFLNAFVFPSMFGVVVNTLLNVIIFGGLIHLFKKLNASNPKWIDSLLVNLKALGIKNFFANEVDYKKKNLENKSNYRNIPFLELLNDNKTLIDEDGIISQVIKLKGIDLSCLDDETKNKLFNKKHNLFKKFPENFNYSFYNLRENIQYVPSKLIKKNHLLQKFEELRDEQFKSLYETTSYIVVSYSTKEKDTFQKLISKIYSNENEIYGYLKKQLFDLSNQTESIIHYLQDYDAEILSYENGLCNFWEKLINCGFTSNWDSKLKGYKFIGNYLVKTDCKVNRSSGVYHYIDKRDVVNKEKLALYLVLDGYPSVQTEAFNKLLSLNQDMVFCQHVKLMNKTVALDKINYKKKILKLCGGFGKTYLDELESALRSILIIDDG